MIVAYMGCLTLLRGHQTVGQTSPTDEDFAAPNSLAPLIMLAAGPGTITAHCHASRSPHPRWFTGNRNYRRNSRGFAALLLAIGVGSRISSGAQSTVTRFMGLIVASMGMQFVLTGLKEFFNL